MVVNASTQAVLTATTAGNAEPGAAQLAMLVTEAGNAVPGVAQAVMLVTIRPPQTKGVGAPQSVIVATYEGENPPAVAQAVLLFTYSTGSVVNLTNRAWQFSLDGHTFYVLSLGEEGTFVYDTTTDQWAKWETLGLTTWNMERGTTWKGDVIAADKQNAIIWRLDPTSFIDDDYKAQTRVITGGLALRQRTFIQNYAFRVTASVGVTAVPTTDPETLPTVLLEYSDDQGNTFIEREALTLIDGAFEQELQWLSLGVMQAPQRVFRITDVGAIARIGGADAEVAGED